MGDFQKSVEDKDRSDRGWIGVSPIEKDKKEKPYGSSSDSISSKPILLATVLHYMKNFFSLFSSKGRNQTSILDQQQILEDLVSFKKMLQILSNEDQSHNTEFTQQFSELWHNLLDVCNHVNVGERENLPIVDKIKIFLNKVQHYPPSEDHSLGYYLTKYVGNEWLPFPFMDILHQLHQQHQEDPTSSQLNEWILNLDEIIVSFDIRTD